MADQRFPPGPIATPASAGLGLALPGDMGYDAWSDQPAVTVPGIATVGAAGTLFLRRFSVAGPAVVNALSMIVSVAGVTLTANQCFCGVWDDNGLLIGLSNDQSVNWTGVGLNTTVLNIGQNGPVINTPYAYAGFWYNGTTPPFFVRSGTVDIAQVNGQASVLARQARAVSANTGLTTAATAPNQLGAVSKIANTHGLVWYALS